MTAPEELDAETVEDFDVPVEVTYPDGSEDDASANFKLDTDGDGTPDSKDKDDDGDGIPDDQEKKDGTNPKVPNQNGAFEPEYKDGNGKPGKPAVVDAPDFKDKDGKDTEAPEGTEFAPNTDEDKAPKYVDTEGNEKPLPAENVTVNPDTLSLIHI